jgi:hypothetical protein
MQHVVGLTFKVKPLTKTENKKVAPNPWYFTVAATLRKSETERVQKASVKF